VLLILLFGYALNLDLDEVPTVVWDQSHTPQSRELLSMFDGSPYFKLIGYTDNYRDLETEIDKGRALIAVVIPGNFADKILASQSVDVQVIVDGSDANTGRLALGYARALSMIYNLKAGAKAVSSMGMGSIEPPIDMQPRAWYNTDLKSTNNLIPGIIVVVMIVIAAMLTSVTVAREWEMGTMEQLISTPIRGPELVFGKVAPYFVIGLVDVAIAVVLGRWLFDVPLRGSVALLFAMAVIFLAGALFFGLMLSIVLKKQVLANQAALLSSYLPTLLLSGFVFAIDNMPQAIQYVTYIIPARYFIALLRGIYLKGIGLEIMWVNALLLTIYAAAMIAAANKRMKLKLE
jgi:ABC-2 type transport system permease protein